MPASSSRCRTSGPCSSPRPPGVVRCLRVEQHRNHHRRIRAPLGDELLRQQACPRKRSRPRHQQAELVVPRQQVHLQDDALASGVDQVEQRLRDGRRVVDIGDLRRPRRHWFGGEDAHVRGLPDGLQQHRTEDRAARERLLLSLLHEPLNAQDVRTRRLAAHQGPRLLRAQSLLAPAHASPSAEPVPAPCPRRPSAAAPGGLEARRASAASVPTAWTAPVRRGGCGSSPPSRAATSPPAPERRRAPVQAVMESHAEEKSHIHLDELALSTLRERMPRWLFALQDPPGVAADVTWTRCWDGLGGRRCISARRD